MVNKQKRKRRLGKSLVQRRKKQEKEKLAKAWRNIFVKAGVLNGNS